jgi:gamma-tubulin complex component 2
MIVGRDTPAARAALARRRQRAAQALRPKQEPKEPQPKQPSKLPLRSQAESTKATTRTTIISNTTAKPENVIHYTSSNKQQRQQRRGSGSMRNARRNRARYRSASPSSRGIATKQEPPKPAKAKQQPPTKPPSKSTAPTTTTITTSVSTSSSSTTIQKQTPTTTTRKSASSPRSLSQKQRSALESKHRFSTQTKTLQQQEQHFVAKTTTTTTNPQKTPNKPPQLSMYLSPKVGIDADESFASHNPLNETLPILSSSPSKVFSPPKENIVPPNTFTSDDDDAAAAAGTYKQTIQILPTRLQVGTSSTQVHVDASCFTSSSPHTIMIRSCQIHQTLTNNNQTTPKLLGWSLGRPEEVWSLIITGSKELRHGDQVQFITTNQQQKQYLGVNGQKPYSLTITQEMDQWTVLIPSKKVLVGRAATVDQQLTRGNPIRSGQPILLRHVGTGGILSMDNKQSLTLLTDSYSSHQDYDHMERLQHHDQLQPTTPNLFSIVKASTPPCPSWIPGGIDDRVYLTGAHYELTLPKEPQTNHLTSIEPILLEEVIGSFLGLQGNYIQITHNQQKQIQFELVTQTNMDKSLSNLVQQILPLSTYYTRVQQFSSSHHPGYEYGRVMQAFCQGLDELLDDYVQFVVQLERHLRNSSKQGILTMKSIYFQITPSLHSMSILDHACRVVNPTKGGALLNALWSLEKMVYMGDVVAKRVLGILLERSSGPYLEMMESWLQSGKLKDPYHEFMIAHGTLGKDTWTDMFRIQPEHVLETIASWTQQQILTTGKYWNAVHACDADSAATSIITNRSIPPLPFQGDSSAILSYIDAMYNSASKKLVHLLRHEFQLEQNLEVMKRYFLLDQGDFLWHFLEAAEEDLSSSNNLAPAKIQHWLTMSIQLVEAHRPPNDDSKDDTLLLPQGLRCRFSSKSLVAYLDSIHGGDLVDPSPVTPLRTAYGSSMNQKSTGIELFCMDFSRIPFPVSLILSPKAMGQYQLLFRHLFFTKYVERRLIRVWRDHQILKKLDALRGLLGPTFLLRQRILHFVQNFLYYMSFEVIDNNWSEMKLAMNPNSQNQGTRQKQQTVDDILEVHNQFLEKTLEACLLTNRDLIKSLTKLLNTCLLFTNQMIRFMDTTKIYDDSSILAAEKRVAIQRNLNERGLSASVLVPAHKQLNKKPKKKTVRRALLETKQERQALIQRQTRRVGREVMSDSYQQMVARFDQVFTENLQDFMMQLNSQTASGQMANLGIRLDYNGFVTASIMNST